MKRPAEAPTADAARQPSGAASVVIGLNAVIAAVDAEEPKVLCVRAGAGGEGDANSWGLPYGAFDPERRRTFESGLRDFVSTQTQVALGYVEQLYTFGDKGREAPAALLAGGDPTARIVSVGYLALAPAPAAVGDTDAAWRSWYEFFPWEDWRRGEPALIGAAILPALDDWIARAPSRAEREARTARTRLAFGLSTPGASSLGWEEERTLERYELMYEAGLVHEAWIDRQRSGQPPPRADRAVSRGTGAAMISDHRRILATAIGRLRGKLKYRPVIFELMPPAFSLLALQRAVEAIIGFELHKQNFRRSVEQSGIVSKTGEAAHQKIGRPAALFSVSAATSLDRAAKGLAIPRLRRSPGGRT